jgi:Tol biopolymer transport system component
VQRLVGFCLVISLGVIPTASGSAAAGLPVRTLLEMRGSVEGFAQDGRYITWANPSPAYRDRRACTRIVQLRDLQMKKTWPLVSEKSSLCEEFGTLDGFQHRMALAGTRVLWGLVDRGFSSFHVALHTASRGTPSRALTNVSMDAGPGEERFRPVPVAGDASSLVYAHTGNIEEQRPYGVARVGRTGRSSLIPETEYTTAVAVQAGRTLLARAVVAGCICNRSPSWSPNGEQIAFVGGWGEGGSDRGQLQVMRADGSNVHILPVGKGIDDPSWSPDGRMLAFNRHPGLFGAASIFVADADGHDLRRVAQGGSPRWSPDGRWLAFTRGGNSTLVFRAQASGGAPRRITAGSDPSWSPDGRRLVVSRRDGLYVVGANGTRARRIARGRYVSPGSWSPDGRLIAYTAHADRTETWVVAPDGTGRRRLSSRSEAVQWSPDSRSIVGIDERDLEARPNLVVIAADGSGEQTLGPGTEPRWSPDGTTVAFVYADEWGDEIARISADGSDRRLLTQTTPEPGRNAIELRETATGRVLSTFNSDRLPSEVALAGSRVALLYAGQLEIRDLNGNLLRQATLARAENLSFSGRWVVYRTGRTIRGLDVRNGRSILITRAANIPVGLSLDGRRVAWAEQPTVSKSRIRAAVLPSQ